MRLPRLLPWWPRVFLFVRAIPAGLARQPLPDYLESILPRPPGRGPRVTDREMARVIWNVLRIGRGRFNNGCFVRSFTRFHFFREMGSPVVFNLGVEVRDAASEDTGWPGWREMVSAPLPGRLRSHAWLTLDGSPYLEFEPERFGSYRVLFRYPLGLEADTGAAGHGARRDRRR